MILTPSYIHYYVFRLPSLYSVSPIYYDTAMIGSIYSRKYNCPEYYIFFREDYLLPPELMSRSGERFFISKEPEKSTSKSGDVQTKLFTETFAKFPKIL